MKKRFFNLENYYKIIYIFLLACGVLMYSSLAGNSSVWADEAYTFATIKHSFREIWNITAADVHPPLYYFLLKGFLMLFGNSLLSARLFSVIPFLLIIGTGGFQLQRLFDEKVALLFMGLFLMFPFALRYAVEVRMYSVAALFVFLNALYAFRSWREDSISDWILFALFGTCAAYTHYFAMVSAGIIYGILFLCIIIDKRHLCMRWLSASVMTIILYVPWINFFLKQISYKVNHEYWIAPITLRVLPGYIHALFGSDGVFAFAVFFCPCYAVTLIYSLNRMGRKENLPALAALAVPFGTIVAGIIVSAFIRPVFVIRYVMPAVPLLVFYMAYMIRKINNKIIATMILTIAFVGGISNYSENLVDIYQEKENIIDEAFVDSCSFADSYIVYSGKITQISQVLSYYDPETDIYLHNVEITGNPYPNFVDYRDFDSEHNRKVILFLEKGDSEIPEKLSDHYEVHFQKTMGLSNGYYTDTYLLTLK